MDATGPKEELDEERKRRENSFARHAETIKVLWRSIGVRSVKVVGGEEQVKKRSVCSSPRFSAAERRHAEEERFP